MATSAIVFSSGSRFTVVSAKNLTAFFEITMYMPAALLTPSRSPTISRAGLIASA